MQSKVGVGAIIGVLAVVLTILGLIAYQTFFATKSNVAEAPPIAKEIPQPTSAPQGGGGAAGEVPPSGK